MQPNLNSRKPATPDKPIIVDDLIVSRLKEYDDYAWHKLMYVSLMTGVDDLIKQIHTLENKIEDLESENEELKNAKAKDSRK